MDFDCFGKEKRKQITKDYWIKPQMHLKLLNGQKKQSCARRPITDKYYSFSFVAKNDKKDSGTFISHIPAIN